MKGIPNTIKIIWNAKFKFQHQSQIFWKNIFLCRILDIEWKNTISCKRWSTIITELQEPNLCFVSLFSKTKFTVKIRSEFALSQPSLRTPTDGFVRNRFRYNASEYLNAGLHIWYVSTMSLVSLATNCIDWKRKIASMNSSDLLLKRRFFNVLFW